MFGYLDPFPFGSGSFGIDPVDWWTPSAASRLPRPYSVPTRYCARTAAGHAQRGGVLRSCGAPRNGAAPHSSVYAEPIGVRAEPIFGGSAPPQRATDPWMRSPRAHRGQKRAEDRGAHFSCSEGNACGTSSTAHHARAQTTEDAGERSPHTHHHQHIQNQCGKHSRTDGNRIGSQQRSADVATAAVKPPRAPLSSKAENLLQRLARVESLAAAEWRPRLEQLNNALCAVPSGEPIPSALGDERKILKHVLEKAEIEVDGVDAAGLETEHERDLLRRARRQVGDNVRDLLGRVDELDLATFEPIDRQTSTSMSVSEDIASSAGDAADSGAEVGQEIARAMSEAMSAADDPEADRSDSYSAPSSCSDQSEPDQTGADATASANQSSSPNEELDRLADDRSPGSASQGLRSIVPSVCETRQFRPTAPHKAPVFADVLPAFWPALESNMWEQKPRSS